MYTTLKTHYSQKLFLTLYTKELYTTTEQRYSRLNIGTTQEWGKICQKGSLRKPLTAIAPPSTQAQCYYYILLQGCTPRKLTAQCVHLRKNLHFTFFGKAQIYTLFSIVSSEWWFYQFLFVAAAIYPNYLECFLAFIFHHINGLGQVMTSLDVLNHDFL